MKMAINDAGLQPEEIDYINAHGTSTGYNDKFETAAIKEVLSDHAYKVAISSTKSMTGHLLGAAGGIEAIISVLAIKKEFFHQRLIMKHQIQNVIWIMFQMRQGNKRLIRH